MPAGDLDSEDEVSATQPQAHQPGGESKTKLCREVGEALIEEFRVQRLALLLLSCSVVNQEDSKPKTYLSTSSSGSDLSMTRVSAT